MVKKIKLHKKEYVRVTATAMCKGCVCYPMPSSTCNKMNDAAKEQHAMDTCISTGNIYVEVS